MPLRVSFTLPDGSADMLRRLAHCIKEAGEGNPSIDEIARALVIDVLMDDALAHGEIASAPAHVRH
jgi:hypothetical protein